MSKRTRGKKANATKPRRQRRSRTPPPQPVPLEEPEPLDDIADALAEDHPLSLLILVSRLLASLEPPRPGPFDPEPDTDVPDRDELVETFLEVDRPETSAMLAAMAALAGDDVLRRRVDRELRSREDPLPTWLAGLGSATAVASAVEAAHVLGDGHTVGLGVRVPGADELALMAYVDHDLGTVVTDVMATRESVAALAERMREATDDPDITVGPLEGADARARLEDAIRTGSMMYPPVESDSWPAARPLLEWALRMLPAGGSIFPRPEWDDEALAAIRERFFASSIGAGLDDPDHRGLLESLLWFGTDYGPGDPLRWSPTAVEIVLTDWIPRKIVADVPYLAKAPALLRAWIRFCHDDRGIRPALTDRTLAAVDEFEDEYQETIRSPRPQGPAALLAALGYDEPDDP